MYARVRDILQRNYLDLLGIPPSGTLKDVRRALQRAEMEAEMGASTVDAGVIEAARAALSSEDRLLEYRILARWAGDERLARWASLHDGALDALRRALGGQPSEAVAAVSAWLEAHRDPSLASVLDAPIQRDGPLWWVGEVAEDYLSAFLIPGAPTMTAYELGTLDFSPFPAAAERVVMKFIQCRIAEVNELAGLVPEFRGGDVDQEAAREAYAYRDELNWLLDDAIVLDGIIDRWALRRAGSSGELTDALRQLADGLASVALRVALYCFALGNREAGKGLTTKLRSVGMDADLREAADLILARVRQVESLPYRARALAIALAVWVFNQAWGLLIVGGLIAAVNKACDSGS